MKDPDSVASAVAPGAAAPPQAIAVEPRSSVLTCLYWLLALALLYTLYFAKSLLMPIVLALLFSLLLTPLVSLFKRYYVPRTISALFLLAMIGGPFTLLGIELGQPAQKWLARLPEVSAQLTGELDSLSKALSPAKATEPVPPAVEEKGFSFFGLFKDDEEELKAEPPATGESALTERFMQGGIEAVVSVLGATPKVIALFATFMILVMFLLIFGPHLYDSVIEIFPIVHNKRRAALMVGRVQKELSRYIMTVSAINMALGLATALVLWLLGTEDALLWGALVGLLNFAPYVGPIIAIAVLSIAGVTQYGLGLSSLLPAGAYFCLNLVESQFVTPTVLGSHMRLNPLVLILWLLVWGWLWGPAGVLLAVPLLVCLKLVAGQLRVLEPWVQLIESRA